jgi:hypothetical protein
MSKIASKIQFIGGNTALTLETAFLALSRMDKELRRFPP